MLGYDKILRYVLYAVCLGVIALILSPGSAVWRKDEVVKVPAAATQPIKSETKPEPVIAANPPEPKIAPAPEPAIPANPPVTVPKLIVPVSGIGPQQLHDNYSDARSEGRVHNAIDIMAAQGTPVLAATDGVIRRIFYSERGGNTLYQLNSYGNMVFYYAHLDRYADGIVEGKAVKQGEVIGYVGDTGNAGAGNYHLHFAIWTVSDPKKFYNGDHINPYPLLR
jgi:murein DD-endopeptidase MepM/ murein hydrolase activator NlpD